MSTDTDGAGDSSALSSQLEITCWILDTRSLWPGDKIDEAAPEALELVSPEEREGIKKKKFIQDARMSLGSALLKRLFISKTLGVPWSEIQFTRRGNPKHGKPCFQSKDDPDVVVEFNVSHQAGLVALVGAVGGDIELGVDIVCVHERDDYRTIDKEGFESWIDIYEDVFSTEDRYDMKYNVDRVVLLNGTEISGHDLGRSDRCCTRGRELFTQPTDQSDPIQFNSDLLIDAKLRRFYTFWAYKEAYIKLSGEALMASWLPKVEFRNVRSPRPGVVARCSTHGTWGEKLNDIEVLSHGETQRDVQMEIQAFEENYMISAALRTSRQPPPKIPSFESVHIESELSQFAHKIA
ncbi:MAG: hypothetical protein M1820_002106 [Bogoriella megaspora]|nr:MAG: hypothetical protein M1820_002106 [Bogoriella megaspora]